MRSAIESFRISAARVRHLGALYSSLQNILTSAVDSTDLLRAQLVLSVSALDYFVHEITIHGIKEIASGERASTESFAKLKISSGIIFQNSNIIAALEEDIRERHSFLSFQQPEKIADAIRIFFDKPLWRAVAVRLSRDEASLKSELRLIVDRRNKIAHEADIDPSFPGARWPITPADCSRAIDLISDICESIYKEVKIPGESEGLQCPPKI